MSFFVWRAPSYPTCQLKKNRIFIKQSKLLKVFIWTCEWNNAPQSFRLIAEISINDGYRNLDKSHWISDKKGKQKGKKSVKIHKLRVNTSGILYIRNSFLKYHSFFYDKINLPQGNKKREKIHMLIFLPKGLKIELFI